MLTISIKNFKVKNWDLELFERKKYIYISRFTRMEPRFFFGGAKAWNNFFNLKLRNILNFNTKLIYKNKNRIHSILTKSIYICILKVKVQRKFKLISIRFSIMHHISHLILNFCVRWIIECKNWRVQIKLDSKLDFNWSLILCDVSI